MWKGAEACDTLFLRTPYNSRTSFNADMIVVCRSRVIDPERVDSIYKSC